MAHLSYYSASWEGDGFDPGVEHYWSTAPVDFAHVINITAHAVAAFDREITVKDIRTHVDEAGNRQVYFTVANTGQNNIAGYTMNHSFVSP